MSATSPGCGMSAGMKRFGEPRVFGQFALLQFAPPGDELLWPVAILMLDLLIDKLYVSRIMHTINVPRARLAQLMPSLVE